MGAAGDKPASKAADLLTVGRYLATPTGMSAYRRIGGALAMLAALSFLLGAAIRIMDGRLILGNEFVLARSIDLTACVMPLMIAGAVMLLSALAVFAVSRILGKPKHDTRAAVKKAALSAMLKCPRMGISENTLLADVKLKCEYVPRTAGGAVQCYCTNNPFIPQDFAQSKAADFAAIDCIVAEGRLYVFFDVEAKRKWMETKNRKRGHHDNR